VSNTSKTAKIIVQLKNSNLHIMHSWTKCYR